MRLGSHGGVVERGQAGLNINFGPNAQILLMLNYISERSTQELSSDLSNLIRYIISDN